MCLYGICLKLLLDFQWHLPMWGWQVIGLALVANARDQIRYSGVGHTLDSLVHPDELCGKVCGEQIS